MVLKGPRFRVSPVRTYVVVGSLVVAVSLVAGASSPSSDLVGTNGTFVDTLPGYWYLYPCTTSISVLLFLPNFFCSCL